MIRSVGGEGGIRRGDVYPVTSCRCPSVNVMSGCAPGLAWEWAQGSSLVLLSVCVGGTWVSVCFFSAVINNTAVGTPCLHGPVELSPLLGSCPLAQRAEREDPEGSSASSLAS